MKFGKYLESKSRPDWRAQYIDYKRLKDLIKAAGRELEQSGGSSGFSPRTTSLTVQRPGVKSEGASEAFFHQLEKEVSKVSKFTDATVSQLRDSLRRLKAAVNHSQPGDRQALQDEATRIGNEFLQLEKYVNLNYMGAHKILKKHDKALPHQPCRQFYTTHLHNQPWVQGTYSDLLVALSAIYSTLRGDTSGTKNEDSAQGFIRSTTKYWVKTSEVSSVKHTILQHLPVFQYSEESSSGDAQLVNSVYLDNSSLELYHGRLDKRPNAVALRLRWYGNGDPQTVFVERKTHRESWKGEESVKERFVLPESRVVPFLEGDYSVEEAVQELASAGRSQAEQDTFAELFTEVQQTVDAKQLRPMMRTQYMRAAFQIPFDATVRISLDTNLTMLKENPDDGPSCTLAGRWYRDPALPVSRGEITRFPHAVLEVKLSLPEGQAAPDWVGTLLGGGHCTEVHKFSKFIHGTCTLMPDMVQAVPYWVDDESVRPSMLASAPAPPIAPLPSPTPVNTARRRAAAAASDDPLTHPLLGDEPSLDLMGAEERSAAHPPRSQAVANFFDRLFKIDRRSAAATMRIEPKTYFANERTFLSWLRMAVTVGSVAAALLGFAASAPRHEYEPEYMLLAITCLILLPLAVVIAVYALGTFLWRGSVISRNSVGNIDDHVGPMGLCVVVVLSLSAIFVMACVDIVESLHRGHHVHPPPTPPPLFPPPPPALEM